MTANNMELRKLNAELQNQLNAEEKVAKVLKADHETLIAINKDQNSKIHLLKKHVEKLTNHIQLLT